MDKEDYSLAMRLLAAEYVYSLNVDTGAVEGGLVMRLLSSRMMNSPLCKAVVDNGLVYFIM